MTRVPPATFPSPTWVHVECLQPCPSPALLDWLLDPGSLTRRLTRLSSGDFAVRVLHAGWQALRADECAALSVPPDSTGWVREVALLGQGQTWVFARSVAAQSVLHGVDFDLGQVGNQSLGEVLFCDPRFTRSALELCHYPPACLPSGLSPDAHTHTLRGRRSCFIRDDLGVLVAEVYLPALWARLGLTEPAVT